MLITNIHNKLFSLSRWQKRSVMLAVDGILLPLSVWLAFSLRLGTLSPESDLPIAPIETLMVLSALVSVPVFIKFGLYRAVIRYIGGQAITATFTAIIVSTLFLVFITLILGIPNIPKSFFPIYAGTAFLLIGGSRYAVRYFYGYLANQTQGKTLVAIYGAGETGRQLNAILFRGHSCIPVFFIDDDPQLQHSIIHGLKIYPPHLLPELINKYNIRQVLLAMPSAPLQRRQDIINYLETIPIHVRTVPGFADIVSGKSYVSELRDIAIEDLLGREAITPNDQLLTLNIRNKRVMVTGAGGSIGSELCRQIVQLQPEKLVLFEISEFSLYSIEKELQDYLLKSGINIKLIPILGSVQDIQRVEEILRCYRVQTIYHAAAYKHVPMVEFNPIEGIKNNTFGTYYTAQAALNAGVERFVLISTDKAVRPTNVMGASKRLCELVIQGFSSVSNSTLFCMVRFGNVLGSSGSVVPLFTKQIESGGPITITHPDIIRYFMTIPEASQLVIQAGAMASGGEVFLLDMGQPVKILDLAKRMVHLSGLRVRDERNPDGDIELHYTGLRAGEKLYEELLIDNNAESTAHPRIFKAHEVELSWEMIKKLLLRLEISCNQRDIEAIYVLLEQYVSGYQHKTCHTRDINIPFGQMVAHY